MEIKDLKSLARFSPEKMAMAIFSGLKRARLFRSLISMSPSLLDGGLRGH